jgi:hypothetical protein
MNTQTRKLPVLFVVMGLAILALATSACSFSTPKQGEISQVIDITLDEDLFSQSSPNFKVHGHNFWEDLDVEVNRLELHDGYLRFLGTQIMPDGSEADCTIDLSLGAENGMLTAKIIAVDIPGTELTDPSVVEINQELDAHLSLDDFSPNAEILFKEVEITNGAMRIKIQVNIKFWTL